MKKMIAAMSSIEKEIISINKRIENDGNLLNSK